MRLCKTVSIGIAAWFVVGVSAIRATAQTFASFLYDGAGSVVYNNSDGTISGTGVAVQFSFNTAGFGPGLLQPGSGPSIGFGNAPATLSIIGHSTGPVTGAGSTSQPYVIDSFSILRDSDNANLLSGSASPAMISVPVAGGTTLNLNSSKPPANTIISLSSDFVIFPSATSASLAWAFTQSSPASSIIVGDNGNYILANGGNPLLNPAGNFTYVPGTSITIVPEPGSFALLATLAICGSVFALRARRRR